MQDHYSTLGVSPTAADPEIKSAYRKLVKEYHPDRNPGMADKFHQVQEAYEVLSTPSRRAQYDGQRRSSTGSPRGQAHYDDFMNTYGHSGASMEDILRDISRSRASWNHGAKNRDITMSYSITLEEAFLGKQADINYVLPGGLNKAISVKIPQGVQDGIKLRFQGKGDDAMSGVAPGDLYVKITVIPNSTFVRMGQNLTTSVTIDYLDAILGTDREIPTIDGGRIRMRIPAGITAGQSLRASAKGMIVGGQRGDMMVEVIIQPGKLNEEQRQLIQQARGKSG
jgi:DnaJ-class molecular chaperone